MTLLLIRYRSLVVCHLVDLKLWHPTCPNISIAFFKIRFAKFCENATDGHPWKYVYFKEWNLKKKSQHASRVEIIPLYYAHFLNGSCVRQDFVIIGSRATARRWVGRQTRWWPRHKAIYFSWFEPELFCLLLGPPGFNCWFSFAPVFQWCCSAPRGSPGVGRNTFLSSPHLCFIIVFICDLFVSRDDSLMS